MGQDVSKEAKTRGGLLSLVLILMIIGQSWFAYLFFTAFLGLPYNAYGEYFASFPTWTLVASASTYLLNIIFLIAIWRWKKWGIFGLIVSWVVNIVIISTVQGISILPGSLLGLVILGLLIKRKWHFFE